MSTDLAILICRGKPFQSLGAKATKARSPKVVEVLNSGMTAVFHYQTENYI